MSKERELLERALKALNGFEDTEEVFDDIKEFLAQPELEPVAWIIETEIEGKLNTWICTDKKHYMDASDGKESIPLYTSPPKQKPLSGKDIAHGFRCSNEATHADSFWAGVEYAEKKHGIGE